MEPWSDHWPQSQLVLEWPLPDTWATGCWRARHAPGLSQAGPKGFKTYTELVAVAIHVVAVELVAVAATLAAVAAALACSSAVVLRDLVIGVRVARLREKCGRGSDRGGCSGSDSGRGDKYRYGDR